MRRLLTALSAAVALSACGAHLPPRPAGGSVPDAAALDLFARATTGCGGLRSLTAGLALSGRAGGERLRGRVLAGLEAGGSVRLEGLAPFGPPIFILAGRGEQATLLLPREQRVLPRASVVDVMERLTGVSLGADDLRLILSACLVETAAPTDGRRWGSGWWTVALADGRVAYLRQAAGVPRVVAADYGPWRLDYQFAATSHWPIAVRVRRGGEGPIDLHVRLEEIETNVPIAERAFTVDVPADARLMTLDELRSAAPLAPKSS